MQLMVGAKRWKQQTTIHRHPEDAQAMQLWSFFFFRTRALPVGIVAPECVCSSARNCYVLVVRRTMGCVARTETHGRHLAILRSGDPSFSADGEGLIQNVQVQRCIRASLVAKKVSSFKAAEAANSSVVVLVSCACEKNRVPLSPLFIQHHHAVIYVLALYKNMCWLRHM